MDGLSCSDVDVHAESASEESVAVSSSVERRAARKRNSARNYVVGERDRARVRPNGVSDAGKLQDQARRDGGCAAVTRTRGMMAVV